MSMEQNFRVLIAPKPLKDFSPNEYHEYVKNMKQQRTTGQSRKISKAVPGITLTKTKKGAWSIRKTKARTFTYITDAEIKLLCADHNVKFSELWNLFKAKSWIIANTKMQAEQIYAEQKNIPW